jgi:serine/threonine-protein kinase
MPPPPASPWLPPWSGLKRVLGLTPTRALPQLTDYAIRQVVARNERGTVYQAIERATGRKVALKRVRIGGAGDADRGLLRQRFLREAQAAARLRHECIVAVHAGGVQGEEGATTGWLAMEWVPGADLSAHTDPARLLPVPVVLGICRCVALALDAAHHAGIVHRDIKPANVMFDPETRTVKVVDFGSASIVDTEATRSGVILGTPAYMAPEQLAGAEPTPQVDLYALGVLMFELLIGRRPFESESTGDLLARIARETPPRVRALRPELPPLLDDIVARLLCKPPGQRQDSARQVALELRVAHQQYNAVEQTPAVPGADPSLDLPGSPPFQGTIAR